MRKALTTSIIAAAGLAVSSLSFAAAMPAQYAPHGWYAGVGINAAPQSAAHVHAGDTINLNNGRYKLDSTHKIGVNAFVGYRLTRYFGTELGVQYIANQDFKGTSTTNNNGKIKERNTWHGYYDGYLYMPICHWFEVFAKGGVSYLHRSENVTGNASPVGDYNNMYNSFALNYGAGVQFDINQWAIRGSYTHIVPQDGSDLYVDIPDTVNLDVLYHFG